MAISEIEGIGPVYAEKLESAGVRSPQALLEAGATRAGRQRLVDETGISAGKIREWSNHADLMRISGVGSESADLLEAAGVDSPAELAQRNAGNLAQTFHELDAARNTVIRIPSEGMVAGWIDQARVLPKVVVH